MSNRFFPHIIAVSALFAGADVGSATPVLALDPGDGALSGAPGAVVGWGFTLSNNSNYLVVTNAAYLSATPIGTFEDYISPQFVVVGPGATLIWSQPFDNNAKTGIGRYQIDASAAAGANSTGLVQVTYDLYAVDPNDSAFNPDTDLLASGNTLSVDASVSATEVVIPEPGSSVLVVAGALAAGAARWATRRRVAGAGLCTPPTP